MAEQNDPFSALGAGLQRGVAMAQQEQQVRQAAEETRAKRQQLELQKMDTVYGGLQRAMTLPKPVQKFAFDRARRQAETLGIEVGPEFLAFAQDPEQQQALSAALGDLMGLPDDERGQAQSQTLAYLAGDDLDKLLPLVEQYRGNQAQQRKLAKDAAQQQFDNVGKVQKETQDLLGKERIESIRQANNLTQLLANPQTARQPFVGSSAQILFAKLLDPGSIVHPSEAVRVEGLIGGFRDKLKLMIERPTEGVRLTEDQRVKMLQAVQILAEGAQTEVQDVVSKQHKRLTGAGVAAEQAAEAFSFVPQYVGIKSRKTLQTRVNAREAYWKSLGLGQGAIDARLQQEFASEIRQAKQEGRRRGNASGKFAAGTQGPSTTAE